MDSSQVLEHLRIHWDELTAMSVRSISLFGSVARDEALPNSDVDLLVEFGEPVGLFEFLDVKERLEDILGVQVDLVTPGSLKPRLRDRILSEAVRAG